VVPQQPGSPGPENNNVRTYTGASDHSRLFAGRQAPIAVMGPDIDQNIAYFNFNADGPRVAGTLAKMGTDQAAQLGDFKLITSLWSPAPWVKTPSGNPSPGPRAGRGQG
jgi:hypothetical protein